MALPFFYLTDTTANQIMMEWRLVNERGDGLFVSLLEEFARQYYG